MGDARRTTGLALAVLVSAGLGCSGEGLILPEEGQPAHLTVVDGDGQADTVGQALPETLVVRVTDPGNRPIKKVVVRFGPLGTAAGSHALPDSGVSDADGRVRVRWVLGTVAGAQQLEARAGAGTALQAVVHATALAGRPASINAVSGDSQVGVVGSTLPQPLVALVTDRFGNPAAGLQASWSTAGGGTVSPPPTVSGADGLLIVSRTLGSTAGTQKATVSASGLQGSPLVFVQISSQGQPGGLQVESGNNQTGAPGQALPQALTVRLVDSLGNGVPGRTITWSVAAGSGGVAPPSGTTDGTGRASATWTLGPSSGTQVVLATSGSLSATFLATATASPPATVTAVSTTVFTGTAGAPANPAPMVRVTDAQGLPVAGVTVSFAVTAGGGSVNPASDRTDSLGLAGVSLWTLGAQAGTNELTATASGPGGPLSGSPVRFQVTTGAGPMSRLTIVQQPSDSAVSANALSRQPGVQVQDAVGNDVAAGGVMITASLAGSPPNASLASNTATTDSTGRADFSGLTITGPAGSYTLVFTSVPSLASASSTPVVLTTPGGGSASSLAVLIEPSSLATDGVPFGTQPTVVVRDGLGLPVGGVDVTVSLASGAGTVGGTLVVTSNVLGLASYTDLSLSGPPGTYTLRFSAGAISTTSRAITLSASTVGPASAGRSTAAVPSRGNRNRPTVIVAQTRDSSGNDLQVGGHAVVITVSGKNTAGPITLTDQGDGTYSGAYTPQNRGKDQVVVTLDGAPIGGSPYSTDVH